MVLFVGCEAGEKEEGSTSGTAADGGDSIVQGEETAADEAFGGVGAIVGLCEKIDNRLSGLEVKEKEYSGEIPGGGGAIEGKITGFYENGKMVKLIDSGFDSHGQAMHAFYFCGGVFCQMFQRTEFEEMTENPKTHIFEKSVYIYQKGVGKVIEKRGVFAKGEARDESKFTTKETDPELVKSAEDVNFYFNRAQTTKGFLESDKSYEEFFGEGN